jgi:hypothetical protein
MITKASMASRRRKERLRAHLRPLVSCCPAGAERNPDDCPLHELRKMEFSQRRKWFNALAEDDLSYLAAYHDVCLHLKLSKNAVAVTAHGHEKNLQLAGNR